MDEQHQNQKTNSQTADGAGSQLDNSYLKLTQESTEAPIVNRNDDKVASNLVMVGALYIC